MITKLKRAAALAWKSLDLLLTLRPGLTGPRRCKVFGAPSFTGGPMTKFRQLARVCAKKGEPYSTLICLSAVRVPIFVLRVLKFFGARIVVNQNGVYYPSWFGPKYKRANRYLRKLNDSADHVFFQSEFSRESYERWVAPVLPTHSILYNAVDLATYHSESRATDPKQARILIFTDVRPLTRGLWKSVLEFLESTHAESQDLRDVTWVLAGQEADQDFFLELSHRLAELRSERELKIETRFDVATADVPALLRSCDAALHLVYNDPCPNKVLECLASGLHVITVSAGGSKELVGDAGQILDVPEGYDYGHYPSTEALSEALKSYFKEPALWRARAIGRAKQFVLESWLEKTVNG